MKKRKFLLPLLVLILLFFSLSGIFKQNGQLIKPELIRVSDIFSSLDKVVEKALEGTKGTYAVVIKNLRTGKTYAMNGNRTFESASLYKLWLMGAVYQAIQKGEIEEDKILSEKIEVLNREFEISEEEIELKEGTVTLSVADALNQMITISHNYAALLLSKEVGTLKVTEFMENYGFHNSEYGSPPKTTAQDISLFFEKLYKGEIVSSEYSQRMLDLLKDQKLNDGLPKLLPEGTVVAHKTGELGLFRHDTGIVFTSKGDYIIVVLSETDSEFGAEERIAQVSQAVYNYFNSQ